MLAKNIGINNGRLTFAGLDTTALAKDFGTPLYLVDYDGIEERCLEYMRAVREALGEGSYPCFAGKALCYTDLYRKLESLNMWIDVVSPGEMYTAQKGGFDLSRAMFHGNNKTDADLKFALEKGIGRIVSDSEDEVVALDRIAGEMGRRAKVLLRLTPGIDPHTFKAVNTGTVESKFGVAIDTGDAERLVVKILGMKNIELLGFHCHIGSQIFEAQPFKDAARKMLTFSADMKNKYGYEAPEINLGGGMAVPYLKGDPSISYTDNIKALGVEIDSLLSELGLSRPRFYLEPGRSIVADNGMTLYTVGTVKEIKGFTNFVSVDGGMADNPRFALYESPYTVINASRADQPSDFVATVCGRCCESGDIIQENVPLARPERGDIIAVCTTGAYNFSMASGYNRLLRPALVAIEKGRARVAVERETFDHLTALDL